MKCIQVRLADELGDAIEEIAQNQEIAKVLVIRRALDLRIQSEVFIQQGRRLLAEDEATKEKIELILPGLTKKPARPR